MAKRLTTDSWRDVLGQSYGAGDIVAISTINSRSPQTVIAKVHAIYTTNSEGKPYFKNSWSATPIPSCVVVAEPLIDARGFGRYGKQKLVSYSIPDNILKLPFTEDQILQNSDNQKGIGGD